MAGEAAKLQALIEVEADKATAELRRFDAAMQTSAKRAESATASVASGSSKLGSVFGSVATAAAGFGAAQIGVASASAALTTGLAGTVGAAMQFQQAIANVGAAVGASKEDMAAMSAEAKKIGADTSVGASEAAAAIGDLVKAGISVQDAVGGVARTVVQMSEASGAAVGDMATFLSDTMNVFKVDAAGASDAANILAKAAAASSIDIQQMAQSMSAGGLVAAQAGLSVEEFATAIGIMGNAGLKASDAGTSLKAFIAGLTPATDKAKAAFEELGIEVFDQQGRWLEFPQILQNVAAGFSGLTEEQRATTAELLFGSDGVRAFNALMASQSAVLADGTTGWQNFGAAMAGAPSIADQSAARMATLSGQIELLKGNLETMGLAIGEKVLPMLTALTEFAVDATQSEAIGAWANALGLLAEKSEVAHAALSKLGDITNILPPQVQIAARAWQFLNDVMTDNFGKSAQIVKAMQDEYGVMGGPLLAATGTYADALKAMTDNKASAADKAAFLTSEYQRLAGQMNTLNAAGQTMTTEGANVRGSLAAVAEAARTAGFTMTTAANGTVTFSAKLKEVPGAASEAGGAAQKLTPLQTMLNAIFQDANKAAKAVRDLVNPPTGAEVQIAANLANIEGAMKNLTAATTTAGGKRQEFIGQAQELIRAANLEGDALASAERIIGQFATGAIDGATAQARLEASLKPTVTTLEAQQTAMASTREALGKTGEAAIQAGTNTGKGMDQIKQEVEDTVKVATGVFPDVPAAAEQAATDTNEALGTIAGPEVTGPIETNATTAGAKLPPPLLAGAQQAKEQADARLSTIGADLGGILYVRGQTAGQQMGAGMAAGINAMQGTVAAASRNLADVASASLNVALAIESPSKRWARSGYYAVMGFTQGIEDQTPAAAEAAANLAEATTAGLTSRLADLEAETKRVSLEKTRLQRLLLDSEPYSQRYADIEAQIKILDAWGQKLSLDTQLLKAEQDALEASRTAFDGFAASREKALNAASMQARVGAGGLAAGLTADELLGSDDPKLGEKLFGDTAAIVERARKAGIDGADALFDAAAAVARERTPEAVNTYLQQLAALRAKLPEEARLNAETYATAFAQSQQQLARQDRMGSGAGILSALDAATTQGGMDTIRRLADEAARFRASLGQLPAYIRDQLTPEVDAAFARLAEAPGDPATLRVVEDAVSRANTALALFPKGIMEQAPIVRQAAVEMFSQVQAGTLSLEEARERMSEIARLIPADYAEMDASVREHIDSVVQSVLNGGMAAAQGMKAIQSVTEAAEAAAAAALESAKALAAEAKQAAEEAAKWAQKAADLKNGVIGPPGAYVQPRSMTVPGASMSLSDEGFKAHTPDPGGGGQSGGYLNYLSPDFRWQYAGMHTAPTPPAFNPIVNVTVQGNVVGNQQFIDDMSGAISRTLAQAAMYGGVNG